MNYFKQHRILWVMLTILIFINMASLSFLYWHIRSSAIENEKPMNEKPGFGMLIQTLEADSHQKQKLYDLRNTMLQRTENIRLAIDNNLRLSKEEINSNTTDTAVLSELATEYGLLQSELRMEALMHLVAIKNQCNPQQKEKLKGFYQKVLMDDTLKKSGSEMGKRYRHRRGWKQNNNK